MPYLTAAQMIDVLDGLPDTDSFQGNYIKIYVKETPADISSTGFTAIAPRARYFEFFKSDDGLEWLLGSVPEF